MHPDFEQTSSSAWERAVISFLDDPNQRALLRDTYLGPDLIENAERFFNSDEFRETLQLIRHYRTSPSTLLDIGSGNGISAIAFARTGYQVTAVEPDPGEYVGRGAIRKLIGHYQLNQLTVVDAFGESLPFPPESFDIVYVRQAMHHASDLDRFVAEAARVLRTQGLLVTVRDHVISDAKDKALFLQTHPLHRHYGGENAYTEQEYLAAFARAGLRIKQRLRYFDSVINYAPLSAQEVKMLPSRLKQNLAMLLERRFGKTGRISLLQQLAYQWICLKAGGPYNERRYPGRMYSFVAEKR